MGKVENRQGLILVLTGPSGVGKDAVMEELMRRLGCSRVVTTTDRPMRPGEVEGVSYYFVTRERFEQRIEAKEFLEHVEYRSANKGTQKSEIERVLDSKDIIIWRIDPSAAANAVSLIQREFPDKGEEIAKRVVSIYISGYPEDIRDRYSARGPGADMKEFEANFLIDQQVWEEYRERYDFVVRNPQERLEETVDTIELILRTARGEIPSPPRV